MAEEEVVKVEVELSPMEERATDQGWRPKEAFIADGGNEKDWRPAKEFLDRGELFSKIEEVKRENRNLKRTMQLFKEHHDKVAKVEYDRALDTLKRQKKEALIEGDADKVIEIDSQILETRDAQKAAVVSQAFQEEQPQINPVFTAWVERNNWYQTNQEMRVTADQVGMAFKQANPETGPDLILKEVEKRIKKIYPEKFINPHKEAAPLVESGGKSPRQSRSNKVELTEEEQSAMRRFVKAGALTEEQYIAEIETMRGIK